MAPGPDLPGVRGGGRVAEELGCALSTVYAAMRRLNVRSPPKGVRWALRARVLQQKQEAQG